MLHPHHYLYRGGENKNKKITLFITMLNQNDAKKSSTLCFVSGLILA